MPTLYDILGVPSKAQPDEVRIAYRKLAREYHPDLNPDPESHERMAQINAAFEVLSDPVRRMEYDASIGQSAFSEPTFENGRNQAPEAVRAVVTGRLRAHRTPVYGAGYFSDTARLVTCSFDNEVIWWNQLADAPEDRMKLEGGVVSAISVGRQGRLVAAGTTEQSLACWRIDGRRVRTWRQSPKEWVVTVAPSPNGEWLAMGSVDSQVKVVSALDGEVRWIGAQHTDSVTALAWSADSRRLATGSADATVRIWDTQGTVVHTIQQVRSAVTSLAFSPDHRWLAVAAVDLSLRIFDLRDGSLRKTFFGHERPIEALAFHPRSWLLGSVSRDGSLGLWNVVHGIGHGRIEASHQPLSCLAFSPRGLELVTGGLDKVLRVWTLSSPKL